MTVRPGVATHNPFEFANNRLEETPRVRVEAQFEKRARIRVELEKLDAEIHSAILKKRFKRIVELNDARTLLARDW